MLVADVAVPGPLLSFSMDAQRYYEFVSEAVMREDVSGDGEPTPLEVREAMRDIMLSSGAVYERMSTRVDLTSRGIELATRMTLTE